jgi:hypothetical protein
MTKFSGNPKPMCYGCCRRVYGYEKDGGWWCGECEQWVVKPPRKRKPKIGEAPR